MGTRCHHHLIFAKHLKITLPNPLQKAFAAKLLENLAGKTPEENRAWITAKVLAMCYQQAGQGLVDGRRALA